MFVEYERFRILFVYSWSVQTLNLVPFVYGLNRSTANNTVEFSRGVVSYGLQSFTVKRQRYSASSFILFFGSSGSTQSMRALLVSALKVYTSAGQERASTIGKISLFCRYFGAVRSSLFIFQDPWIGLYEVYS